MIEKIFFPLPSVPCRMKAWAWILSVVALFSGVAPPATAQNIQMLPPTDFGSAAGECSQGGVLYWDLFTPIHCIPGFVGDAFGNVGIGLTVAPRARLDVSGEIRLGDSGTACSSTNEGSLRYNTTSNSMEFCNATEWKTIATAKLSPIVCQITNFPVGFDEHATHTVAFTAADCGGTLPDANYVGTFAAMEVCGSDESWIVNQPPNPTVTFWTVGHCGLDGPLSAAANIQVVFIHK